MADPIKSVSPAGFWDWINTAGSDDTLEVTVSIPDVSEFATASNLRLVGWNGTEWVALSASPTANGTAENSTLSGTIPAGTSITALAIGSIENSLPVTLLSFNARPVEKIIALQWTTTEEVNASHFEIQKSRDTKNFESIGQVNATGKGETLVNYTFHDQAPFQGINYYRLKQVDRDGTYSFSKTISILFGTEIEVSLYPNPVTDVLRIRSGVALQSLEVFTIGGVKVTGITGAVNNGTAGTSKFRELDFRHQKPGIYVLVVNGRSFKILKN